MNASAGVLAAMAHRYFSLVVGAVLLVVGVAGFIPGLVTSPPPEAPDLALEGGHGRLFALFPVNWLLNLIHIAFGIGGVVCYRDEYAARSYANLCAVAFGLLVAFAFIPGLHTMLGLAPLFGANIGLHLLIATPAVYFGYSDKARRHWL